MGITVEKLFEMEEFKNYKDKIVKGNFQNLNVFAFRGVYIIHEKNNGKIVYIGSAYARDINIRLKQYLRPNDSGNTLRKSIARNNGGKKQDGNFKDGYLTDAVKQIEKYEITAIIYKDLEYHLIKKVRPKYNNIGMDED